MKQDNRDILLIAVVAFVAVVGIVAITKLTNFPSMPYYDSMMDENGIYAGQALRVPIDGDPAISRPTTTTKGIFPTVKTTTRPSTVRTTTRLTTRYTTTTRWPTTTTIRPFPTTSTRKTTTTRIFIDTTSIRPFPTTSTRKTTTSVGCSPGWLNPGCSGITVVDRYKDTDCSIREFPRINCPFYCSEGTCVSWNATGTNSTG